MTAAFPLQWPDHMDRSRQREKGRFDTTLPRAINNVETSVERFAKDSGKKIDGFVVSSNYSLTDRKPADPGVSVWFTWDGMQVCIPVDRYASVEANLQAIHHVIEARRTELRHGTLALVRASFQGFRALPPPKGGGGSSPWWQVLELPDPAKHRVTATEVARAYRELAKTHHPNAGGDRKDWDAIAAAHEAGLKEVAD